MNLVNHSLSRSRRPTDWGRTDELAKGRYPRVWIVIASNCEPKPGNAIAWISWPVSIADIPSRIGRAQRAVKL